VVAVGTTVVRALESAWSADEHTVVPRSGFTRLLVHPGRGVFAVDGLLTGFHDPGASHLAMLYAVAGKDLVRDGYERAIKGRYLWHEFGDSHLLLPR
jgi:S-adenosylmethionine:tRNA ribosyltransferase-isomerase